MKRNKTALLLMEQLVMLLIFALAATVCLQAFVYAHRLSLDVEARDRAAELAQSVAETLRHTGGDFPGAARMLDAQQFDADSLRLELDADWAPAEDTARYVLGAGRQASDLPGLGRGQVWLRSEAEDRELLRLDITWQEVIPGES